MNDYTATRRKQPSLRPLIMAVLFAFIFGGLIAGYGVWRYAENTTPEVEAQTDAVPVPTQAAAPVKEQGNNGDEPTPQSQAAAQAVERVEEQQGGIDQRLAAAEQRLARLDLQSEAAAGNAARAEGLLIAFATRRSLERGAELGFLADQLRLRFGDALPNAVRTIINSSRDPITVDQLIGRLDNLAPRLAEEDRDFSWDMLRGELANLFVIRRESTPSPQPERRLDRARLFLQSGRVEPAIAEVRNLPGAENARNWIEDAERFAATQRALELIETSAVLEPRMLRDGSGNRIEQPTPALGVPEAE